MQIFAGSSNRELAKRVAELLGIPLGKAEIGAFANGETRIRVAEKKVDERVVVVQSLSSPTNEHLVEFCILCDALKRAGAREIVAVIPWMGYGKQDKIFRTGEPLSAKVVAEIIQTARLAKIITYDLHNSSTLGYFDTPIVELSAKPLLLSHFTGFDGIVVAPDEGSIKASREFAEKLGVEVVYLEKQRDRESGEVMIKGMNGGVEGKEVLIVDDNIFTGETLIKAAEYLKKKGAKSVRVGATHYLNIPGVAEKLERSEIESIVVTDTIQQISDSANQRVSNKMKIVSVAEQIVDELR